MSKFNPHRISHCKAYRHLQKTGQWPEEFKCRDVGGGTNWQVSIMAKCTKAWIDQMLEEEEKK